ncbi:MAG: HAMP domain-containing histidine kinase [Chloroflexi bacterium]|nr:HAMP domain-containing histidine kinase [Chloroflexota bacterium]
MNSAHDVLSVWSSEIIQFIDNQEAAAAVGLIDTQGRVIYSNGGMQNLLRDETTGKFQLERLSSPTWQTLLSLTNHHGRLYTGWLTFDGPAARRSLRGEVWQRNDQLLILASYNVEDLMRVNQQIVALNNEMTNLQHELARKNAALINTFDQLSTINQQLEQEAVERRRIEEQLRQSNQELQAHNEELDAFAHTVAHDLKNPLGVILGYAAMLQDSLETMSPDFVYRILDAIVAGSQQMSNIINELLLLADTRTLDKIDVKPLDMEQVAGKALLRLQKMIADYDAQVVFHHSDPWPNVLGYAPWIEEVWVNYLSNAMKYGGKPPRIEVGATLKDDNAGYFWVRDNGAGIDPEKQPLLFAPFTQLNSIKVDGHGLGLSIVKRIVHRLGGAVVVQSEVGQGSQFGFVLPISAVG